jgi:hypothetical protein
MAFERQSNQGKAKNNLKTLLRKQQLQAAREEDKEDELPLEETWTKAGTEKRPWGGTKSDPGEAPKAAQWGGAKATRGAKREPKTGSYSELVLGSPGG